VVLGLDAVRRFARLVVREAEHRERRRKRPGAGVVEGEQADGRPDEAGETLGDHAVEVLGLGDQGPVAADLVKQGEGAHAGLGLLAIPLGQVVEGLEPEEGPHLEDQGPGVHGLAEHVLGAGVEALAHRGRVPEGRQHHDGHRRAVGFPDPGAGLEAADPGQAHVEEHEVGGLPRQDVEGLLPGLRPDGRVPVECPAGPPGRGRR
jgi:hypothetical protein